MTENAPYLFKPGIHSRNYERRVLIQQGPKQRFSFIRIAFLLVGLACLSYYAYTLADQKIYQVYENWAFDQQISGRPAVTFRDYLREQTPFAFLAGTNQAPLPQVTTSQDSALVPIDGSVMGRVTIERLNLSAVVKQGVGETTLSQAVGHVPSTALAGQIGNFAIAAHRDTLFRALKDIQKGDIVTFQSQKALFDYKVLATKIVKPTDVSVISPDGGGLIAAQTGETPGKLLTMITCYPFYYVGSAPKRFIVQAELVGNSEQTAGLKHE